MCCDGNVCPVARLLGGLQIVTLSQAMQVVLVVLQVELQVW